MGTPDFSVPALKAIVECDFCDVVGVYSQPPRPSGRGHKLKKSPVHLYAEEQGISVFTPKSLKSTEQQDVFADLKADLAVVAAYGLILPQAVLDAPTHGCLNIHASLLPRWRGASPIQSAIWAGDQESGVTIMQMEAGLDTGPMILKDSVTINKDMTAQNLHDALSALGGEMIVRVLSDLHQNGKVEKEPQDDVLSTYARLLTKQDGQIDWTQSATEIDRQIRALNPWPGTHTKTQDKSLKILKAIVLEEAHNKDAGVILNKQSDIACGNATILRLLQVKPDNAKAMDAASALNGGYLKIGDQLG